MTNKINYDSMLKDGIIKASIDDTMGRGVFATELTNLFKHWRKDKCWENASLQEKLIKHAAKDADEIVILRIPTKNLDQDKLKIRSQNTLFKWAFSDNADKAYDEVEKQIAKLPKENQDWLQKFAQTIKSFLKASEPNELSTHLTDGLPAKNSSLFEQKKHAIEYVYIEDIPISNVTKIGELDLGKLHQSREYDPAKPMKSIFSALLKDAPEVKAAQFLDC